MKIPASFRLYTGTLAIFVIAFFVFKVMMDIANDIRKQLGQNQNTKPNTSSFFVGIQGVRNILKREIYLLLFYQKAIRILLNR